MIEFAIGLLVGFFAGQMFHVSLRGDYMSDKHPGFKRVQKKIEAEGYTKEQAGAILASKTRNASPAAKAKNPHLKRVKGKAK